MKYGLYVVGPLVKKIDLINDPTYTPEKGWYKEEILTEVPENIDTVLEELKSLVNDSTLWKIDNFKIQKESDSPRRINGFNSPEYNINIPGYNIPGWEGYFLYVNVSINNKEDTKKWRIPYDYDKLFTLISRNFRNKLLWKYYIEYTENIEDIKNRGYIPYTSEKYRIKSTPYIEYKIPEKKYQFN